MSILQEKETGTQYTLTVALLLCAFHFSPALFVMNGQFGGKFIFMMLLCSSVCAMLARLSWKRHSHLTIPSFESPRPRGEK